MSSEKLVVKKKSIKIPKKNLKFFSRLAQLSRETNFEIFLKSCSKISYPHKSPQISESPNPKIPKSPNQVSSPSQTTKKFKKLFRKIFAAYHNLVGKIRWKIFSKKFCSQIASSRKSPNPQILKSRNPQLKLPKIQKSTWTKWSWKIFEKYLKNILLNKNLGNSEKIFL